MTTPEDRENSARLLHLFDAETLGDGNVDAGANVLAAMALTISNLLRPGTAVISADGSETKLGCSMLVSGALSASLPASSSRSASDNGDTLNWPTGVLHTIFLKRDRRGARGERQGDKQGGGANGAWCRGQHGWM